MKPLIHLMLAGLITGCLHAQSPYDSLQVPKQIQYQGRVATGTGAAWSGNEGYFVFALLVGPTGSETVLWNNWEGTASPSDPETVSLGAGQVLTLPVNQGVFSIRLGEGSDTNQQIPATVFFDTVSNSVRTGVKLAMWFSPDGGTFTRLSPDVEFTSVPYAMVSGISEAMKERAVTTAMLADGQVTSDKLAPTVTVNGTFSGDGTGLSGVTAASVAIPPGMALIPAGEFTMGDSLDGMSNATPTVSTTVSAFYMDVNEVTLSQWQAVYYWAKDNGYTDLPSGSGKGPNHPVHTVSWFDCVKWCNARSEQAGKTPVYYTDDAQTTIYKTGNVNVTNAQVKWAANGYRLPTEAEWEKAARGGRSGQRFPWGNTTTQNLANYYGNTGSNAYDLGPNGYNTTGSVGETSPATSPVGSFAANGYGLNDMAGNVWEWCWDWYGTPYAGGTDPKGAPAGSNRVLRGGNWSNNANFARCAFRNIGPPDRASYGNGFRAVLPPGQP